MKLVVGIFLTTAFHVSQSFRVVRSSTRQHIECTLEVYQIDWEVGEARSDEVGSCESADGTRILLNFADIEHLESGDHISLAVASDEMSVAALPQVMGKPVYRAFDIVVLSEPKIQSMLSVASWIPSVLMVETVWSDGSRSASKADIRASSLQMVERFRNDSYGKFVPKIEYTTAKVPRSFATFVASGECHAGPAVKLVTNMPAVAAKRSRHTYVMVFIPSEPACGGGNWAGIAITGCGKPKDRPPAPTNCWVAIRGAAGTNTMVHELGHNLGLGHARGRGQNGEMTDYGDVWDVMGKGTAFSADARYSFGWLPSGQGGVLPAQSGLFVLGALEGPLNLPRTDGVAVMMTCTDCRPERKGFEDKRGGHLFVSYLRGKAAVHFRPTKYGGMESWAQLGKGESWKSPSSANAVHVCELSANLVRVGVGSSARAAKAQCSNDAPSPPPQPQYERLPDKDKCPEGKQIDSARECWKAAESLGYPKRRNGKWQRKPPGCILENGEAWYNKGNGGKPQENIPSICRT